MAMNPLLNNVTLPAFSEIKAEHVLPAIKDLLEKNKKDIEHLISQTDISPKDFLEGIQHIENRLTKAWSPVRHMNAVVNSSELREAYTACLPLLSEYSTEVGQNEELYNCYQSLAEDMSCLNAVERKVVENTLRDFKLTGVSLHRDKKDQYKKLSAQLSELTSKYSDNVLDSTNAWTKKIKDETLLEGLSESAIAMAKAAAHEREQEGYIITLDFPHYIAVMTYADNRDFRQEMYRAYSTKASDQSADATQWDNQKLMEQILSLRHQRAKLLGFKNYAEQSLYSKMAETPEQVLGFINDLLDKSKSQGIEEINVLKEYARKHLGIDDLKPWDFAYVSEKVKEQSLGFSEEELKPWFVVDKVIAGLFELVEQLYEIRISLHEGADVWHPDVKFYDIRNNEGELIAQFYFDLYARQHKRGGAWMDSFCGRFKNNECMQTPIAYMTCNSAPQVEGKPTLFTHDEVITLFHEFGHGLHHMLTTVDALEVSGISGVEWDAVELPSQFMENWCWEKQSLDLFARHYETGEVIPDDLFEKMQAGRHFNSGIAMLRQLEFALFDMLLHMDENLHSYAEIQQVLEKVRLKTSLLPVPEYNRFQNSFSHIFAGGYAAGYYSYKWAEVLSADAFSEFENRGLFDQDTAKAFKKEILERGGSRPAAESFKAFMGREPEVDALLRHSGIKAA